MAAIERVHKDVVILDNKTEVRIRVFGMDCVSALRWITQVAVMLVEAGVPIPAGISNMLKDLGGVAASKLKDGGVFQMPNLKQSAVEQCMNALHPWAAFVITVDGAEPSFQQISDASLKGHFRSPFSILKLYSEIINFNLSFFGIGAT